MLGNLWLTVGVVIAVPIILIVFLLLFIMQGVFVSVLSEYQEQLIKNNYIDFGGTVANRVRRAGVDCFLFFSGIIIFLLPIKAVPCIEVYQQRDSSIPWNLGANSPRWYKWFSRTGFRQFSLAHNNYEVCTVVKRWNRVWYAYGLEKYRDVVVRVGFDNELSAKRILDVAKYYDEIILQSVLGNGKKQ